MVRLNRKLIQAYQPPVPVEIPPSATLDYPEKVLQFGAGVFLRAFLEDFIQQANSHGEFRGRVVVVQRAPDSRSRQAAEQDGLYTLWLRGVSGGALTETRRVIGSISRILSASEQWHHVLEVARSPELEVIISNTTEVGYATETGDSLQAAPPPSYPAKLAQVLWERFRHFGGDLARAPVVMPCELLENNGPLLRQKVLEVSDHWGLPGAFVRWVEENVAFCSTLVDRIVTGPPARDQAETEWARLGYRDELLIAAEPYYLLAVQDPDGRARAALPIDDTSPNVLFTSDITPYWTRKLRLLNGPHTLLAPQGLLAGARTVKEALDRPELRHYLEEAMREIVVALGEEDRQSNESFARQVLDRFSNPFVEHLLANISVNCATKAGVRVFPMIRAYHQRTGEAPRHLLRGIAAVLRFTGGDMGEVRDPAAPFFADLWARHGSPEEFVRAALANPTAWGGQQLDPDMFAAPLAAELKDLMGVQAART